MNAGFNTFNQNDFPTSAMFPSQTSGFVGQAKPRQVVESMPTASYSGITSHTLTDASKQLGEFSSSPRNENFDLATFATPDSSTTRGGINSSMLLGTTTNNLFSSTSPSFSLPDVLSQRSQKLTEVQARSWLDFKTVDDWVKDTLHGGATTVSSRSMTDIFFNEVGEQSLVGFSSIGSPAYWQQIVSKSTALKNAIDSGLKNPKSWLPVAGELAHASWTRSFTEAWAGNKVVSNSLSAIASGLFVWNAGSKTGEAYDAAKEDGQTGGELATTTTVEGVKNFGKAGAAWFMGDVGATLFKNLFGSEFTALKDTKFARFKNVPAQVMAIIGAVIFGTATQAAMEALLPSYQAKKDGISSSK
jgi:hypothetical protein